MRFRTSCTIIVGLFMILLLSRMSSALWWTEATMSSNPEGTTQIGLNESMANASSHINLDLLPNSGTGVCYTNNDCDYLDL